MKKNVSGQKVGVQMVSATDGSAFTGSVTVEVTLDAGTQATGSVGSGACTHEGNGYHTYAPSQAETNGDLAAFTFHGTGAIPKTVSIYTTFPQTGDSFARIGAPVGASISADIAGVQSDTDNIQTRIPAALTANGNMKSSVLEFLTTALTEGATGRFTGGIKKFFDIASPASTMDSLTLVATATTLTNAPSDSAGVTTLLSRIPSSLFSGITSLAQWLGLLAGKQTGNTTARTELRATGAGSGTFDETTDSQEAIRDRGDSAWTTATSVTVSDKTGFALTAAYDAAKTAAQAGDAMTLETDAVDAAALASDAVAEIQSGLSTLTQANVRTAIGLASANLDTQLDALPTAADVASAVQSSAASTPLPANIKKVNDVTLTGTGVLGDEWEP